MDHAFYRKRPGDAGPVAPPLRRWTAKPKRHRVTTCRTSVLPQLPEAYCAVLESCVFMLCHVTLREPDMTKTPKTLLLAALMISPLAFGATLELPSDARIEVELIDTLVLDQEEPRRDNILLRPVADGRGTHQLPDHCVMTGDARLEGERLRVTTSSVTCIATDGGDSDIFSGEMSAAAYETDGSYGLDACQGGRCELTPAHGFELRLASDLVIEEQENPSAQINERRRQANGGGVANPIPSERPDPEQ